MKGRGANHHLDNGFNVAQKSCGSCAHGAWPYWSRERTDSAVTTMRLHILRRSVRVIGCS